MSMHIKNNKKSAKINFFCPALTSGGLERVISILSTPFADCYDHVMILTWYEKPVFYEIDKRIKIVSIEKEIQSNNSIIKLWWLRRYVKNNKPNVFVSFSAPFNMIALISLLFLNVKVVVSERVDPASFRWGWYKKIIRDVLYFFADGIIVQTESSKSHLYKYLQNKASVIPNPVNMPNNMVGSAIKTNSQPLVITATRLAKQKKLDLLISAFSVFYKTHSNYRLVIYGEGRERESLDALVRENKLQNIVMMPGVSDNLWEEMKSARMFILTSSFEGMSNSLIEAMCLGLPCISTKVSGSIDYIENGVNGLLIGLDDEKSLTDYMSRIADDDILAQSLANNAKMIYDQLNVKRVSCLWINEISKYV